MSDPKNSQEQLLKDLRDNIPEENLSYDRLLQALRQGVEVCPFNRLLGMEIQSLSKDEARIRIQMKEELVGNEIKGILHGGVISSVLDVTGSIAATVAILEEMKGRPFKEIVERSLKVGTLDLRIDYLRPGHGKYFLATASVLRPGTSVSVARMELHNDQQQLIAAGTGTYRVG